MPDMNKRAASPEAVREPIPVLTAAPEMAVHFDNLPRCGVLAMSSGKRLPTSMPNELTAMAMPLRSAL